jgi:hypothetical protein
MKSMVYGILAWTLLGIVYIIFITGWLVRADRVVGNQDSVMVVINSSTYTCILNQ